MVSKMKSPRKALCEGRRYSSYYISAVLCASAAMAMALSAAIYCCEAVNLLPIPEKYRLPCYVVATYVIVSTALSFMVRSKRFYLADLPLKHSSGWLMLILLLGAFPALIVSFCAMQRARWDYARADRNNRRQREQLKRKTQDIPKRECFPRSAQKGLYDLYLEQWTMGLARERNLRLDKASKLQNEIARLQAELSECKEWLQGHPQSLKPPKESLDLIDGALRGLQGMPGIYQVEAVYNDGSAKKLRAIVVRLRMVDDPACARYDLGDFVINLYTDHYEWRETRSGLKENRRCLCKQLRLSTPPAFLTDGEVADVLPLSTTRSYQSPLANDCIVEVVGQIIATIRQYVELRALWAYGINGEYEDKVEECIQQSHLPVALLRDR